MIIPFPHLCNIYSQDIGEDTFIGPFVEIQKGAKIGRRCRIQSHTFICSGVTIGDDVFIGHGVMFVNDKYPKVGQEWEELPTVVENGVSIGSGAVILPVVIGANALVGAGSVVTKNVPWGAVVKGNPAK